MSNHYQGKKTFSENLKQIFWHAIYPIFPYLRDGLVKTGILHHHGRQPFYLGHLAPNFTTEKLIEHLHKQGFHRHVVAWHDDGEILSMRKHDSFQYQHHIRLFDDKEIRGHFELTPESKPFDHFFEKGMVPAKEDFKKYLGDYLVEDASTYTISHKASDALITSP